MSIRALAFAAGAAALAFAVPALAGGETSTSTTTTRDADGHVERVIVLSEHGDRHGGNENHVYTIPTGGGAFEIHGRDGTVYRLDRDDGGPFVVNDRDGTTYRVGQGDGVVVLRAKDGRTYRVDGGQRDFMIHARDGRAYRLSALGGCGAAHPLVDRSTGDGGENNRVLICSDHDVSAAERTSRLEHALERIQQMDGLSDSSKERVTAALRQAIEELRNAH
jgi:hypothetical protein